MRRQPLQLHAFWTAQAVDDYSHEHGWSPALRAQAWEVVTAAANELPAGARISQARLRAHGGTRLLADALTDLNVLTDPRDPLPALLQARTADLPPGIAGDLAAWMLVLRAGGRRSRPKAWKTVVEYSGRVRPLLLRWGVNHQHLREVTADQLHQAVAAVPAGSARRNLLVAVRSMFRFLHRDGRLFVNPATRAHLGGVPLPVLLPLTGQDYARLAARATSELHRAVLVLTAVHAARPHALRALRLTDVDLTREQLTLGGVPRALDELSVSTLADWLRYRHRTWPLTANPHLLISSAGASTGKPISDTTLAALFNGSGVTLDRLRMDRHLEEALAHGPDPLHLARTFGVSKATGIRYATNAKQLLQPPANPP